MPAVMVLMMFIPSAPLTRHLLRLLLAATLKAPEEM
uniref:Uncharacterized protein n=1 Tax=Anguilla anguilla TaxID=7936 RepID=A0A0E9XIZ9_ANGAN